MTTTLLDDRYALGETLGRGGACEVFTARDRRLQRDVAVKVLRGEGIGDAERMATEAQLLASFNHPGLVQVFDAGEVNGRPYVVLELVEGVTLADRLRAGPIPTEAVALLGLAVADALVSVHERGVVHRDITPANVLCGSDGRVRVADFGIARLVDSARQTTTSLALGTPAYMAPEQVRGLAATPAVDVYALGLVLVEALTGRRAFEGTGTEVALARLVQAPDVHTDVPGGWQPLLAAMTALDPADRPSTEEVRSRLERLAMAPVELTGAVSSWSPGSDGDVDPLAVTTAVPVAEAEAVEPEGGTAVLPVALVPESASIELAPAPPRSSRRALVGLVVALLLVVAAGIAQAASGNGVDPRLLSTSTSTTVSGATTPVVSTPTTAAPPPTTAAPAPTHKAKGHEHRGKD